MTRVMKRQRHAETVRADRFHAAMGLFAARGLEQGQYQLPAIGIVREDPALLPLALAQFTSKQGLLGYIERQ
jgi:hypothetical protein